MSFLAASGGAGAGGSLGSYMAMAQAMNQDSQQNKVNLPQTQIDDVQIPSVTPYQEMTQWLTPEMLRQRYLARNGFSFRG